MKLITKELENKTPKLYSNEEKTAEETMVIAKFFNPYGSQTWWMTEYDPEQKLAFGYADLGFGCPELGYFSIAEMEEIRIKPFGGKIERDIHFTPCTLASVMEQAKV
tara:strand:- start:77 stop:397 length:321 start_codon:yes stop_codon:yes gene_type:complete